MSYVNLQGTCRGVKCSPGRIYYNGDCSGLFLSYTSHIFYGLAAKITFKEVVSQNRIQINELVNGMIDTFFSMYYKSIIKYYVTVDVPCTSGKVLESVEQFHMFINVVFVRYHVSRDSLDSEYLALLNTQLKIQIGRLTASLFIENDWKSTHLPQLVNLEFPFYYCKDIYITPVPIIPEDWHRPGIHVFMIDKFLLCPQISLNRTEYHILDRSNKLQLQNARKVNARLDYTKEEDGVRVCLMEYEAIMALSCKKGMEINIAILIITCLFVRFGYFV